MSESVDTFHTGDVQCCRAHSYLKDPGFAEAIEPEMYILNPIEAID